MAESTYCPCCQGSGEGRHDGSKCSYCRGTGEVMVDDELDDDARKEPIKAKYDAWTNERLAEDEILYRRYTTKYYAFGGPHPLKAPDEIRRRMSRSARVWHDRMKRALAYAERRKDAWIARLKTEEKYLRSAGWKTIPFKHEEYLGDHDTWVSPRRFNCYGVVTRKGEKMSRMGAMSTQCDHDGHVAKKNVTGPMGMDLVCCSRCGGVFPPRNRSTSVSTTGRTVDDECDDE